MNQRKTPSKESISRKHLLIIAILVAIGLISGAALLFKGKSTSGADEHGEHAEESESKSSEKSEGHGHAAEKSADGHAKPAKGRNGGDLLEQGDAGVELLLSEEGGAPRFKAWLYDKDQPQDVTGKSVLITLMRPGGEKQEVRLTPSGKFLTSDQAIPEPHIFDGEAQLQTAGGPVTLKFSKDEGKVEMTDAQIQAAGISLDTSSPANIRGTLRIPGEIRFNEDKTAHIVPRVVGVVDSVGANLGQQVKKGQVLAVISSMAVSEVRAELQASQKRRELAQSTYDRERTLWEQKISPQQDVLQAQQTLRETEIAVANATQKLLALGASPQSGALGRFELRAPFDGIIVEKHVALGEAVREDTNLFTISDLTTVWAEMSVPARDLPQVRVGEKVVVKSGAFDAAAQGAVSYVGALIGEQTRTAVARVTLPNPQGAWRPGLYVNVEVVASESAAPVTVDSSAIQTLDEKPVVFVKTTGGFIPQPVQLGRTDGKRVEVLSGLRAGATYAAAGSFVVKSEQGKGSASHGH
jgi:cobalt-zinc-cadmium efflux system membrane fusion protein